MQTAIQEGLNVKVLILPPGQDPDEVIRHDAADFRRRAVSALPFMEYAFDTVLASLDLTQAHHKKQAAAELLPMIAIFPDKIEQSHYLQILASKLNVNVAILQEKLAQIIQKKWQAEQHYASHNVAQASAGAQPSATSSRRPVTRPSPTIKLDKLTQTCQLLSAIILQQPADFPVAANELKLEMVASGPLRDLYKIFLNHYNQFDKLDPQQIAIEDLTTKAKLQELELLGEEKFGHLDTSQKQQELWSLVRHVKLLWLKSQLAQLQAKIAQAEQSNDLPELSALLKLHQQFLEQRLKLE